MVHFPLTACPLRGLIAQVSFVYRRLADGHESRLYRRGKVMSRVIFGGPNGSTLTQCELTVPHNSRRIIFRIITDGTSGLIGVGEGCFHLIVLESNHARCAALHNNARLNSRLSQTRQNQRRWRSAWTFHSEVTFGESMNEAAQDLALVEAVIELALSRSYQWRMVVN